MTDDTTDVPAAAEPAPPAQQPDIFEMVMALVQVAVDAEAVKNRVSELRKEGRQISRARIELAQERAREVEVTRRERAEIEQERAELDKREEELRQHEARADAMLETLSRPPDPYARLVRHSGGLTQEPDDAVPSRGSDPHFGRHSATASDEEMVLEKVGSASTTLTRSVPKRPRSMRRGVDG